MNVYLILFVGCRLMAETYQGGLHSSTETEQTKLGILKAMQHPTRLMLLLITLVCSLAPTMRADLLGSLTFDLRGSGNGMQGEPPVLLTLFSTISPPGLGFAGCFTGPYLPAPGHPCFSLIQENLTAADVGRSFVIDENTNNDFSTITSLLSNGASLMATGFTYPTGIVPTLPVADAPPGWLAGGGTGVDTPGIPNADITQLQFTLTSLCMSNEGRCEPGTAEDLSFSARLDVYGEPVPEPATWLHTVTGFVLVGFLTGTRKFIKCFASRHARATARESFQ